MESERTAIVHDRRRRAGWRGSAASAGFSTVTDFARLRGSSMLRLLPARHEKKELSGCATAGRSLRAEFDAEWRSRRVSACGLERALGLSTERRVSEVRIGDCARARRIGVGQTLHDLQHSLLPGAIRREGAQHSDVDAARRSTRCCRQQHRERPVARRTSREPHRPLAGSVRVSRGPKPSALRTAVARSGSVGRSTAHAAAASGSWLAQFVARMFTSCCACGPARFVPSSSTRRAAAAPSRCATASASVVAASAYQASPRNCRASRRRLADRFARNLVQHRESTARVPWPALASRRQSRLGGRAWRAVDRPVGRCSATPRPHSPAANAWHPPAKAPTTTTPP